jgi:NAD(P)-dependent dehydrogenase (short-subunit alcohol dehydrogenase family)
MQGLGAATQKERHVGSRTGTALVTGTTAGIGRAVAELLAHRGTSVVVPGRDPEWGAHFVDEISGVATEAPPSPV